MSDHGEVCREFVDPLDFSGGLAPGTIPVAAGVIGGPAVPATVASVEVSAQGSGTAKGNGLKSFFLFGAEFMRFEKLLCTAAEYIGNLYALGFVFHD